MSPGIVRLLDIPEFQQVLSSYDGDSGTALAAAGKASYLACCEVASRDSSPVDAGA